MALAEIFGVKYVRIDCAGRDIVSFGGSSKNYSDAQPGAFIVKLVEAREADCVLHLDEIDKLVKNEHGDAFDVLVKPLGAEHMYHDSFTDLDTDVSNCRIICTGNDITKIPDYILNRFGNAVFYIPSYEPEVKTEIALRHLIPNAMKELHIDAADLVFSREAVELVAEEYCPDEGARVMASNIEDLARKAINGWCRGLEPRPLTIDTAFVAKYLSKPKSTKLRKIGF